jgi:CCR4-NOT transcription complex subunit 4
MNLANKRVIQKNLIYLTNLPLKYSSEEALRKCGVLTRFGKVIKCVVNKRPSTTTTNATCCAHITYETIDEAYDALQGLNDTVLEGKHLKAQYGTTKYCTMYLKNEKCPNPNCMYLHELGGDDAQEESLERDYHM